MDGLQSWYRRGYRHRADGPAVTWQDGTKRWWLNGGILSFDAWLDRTPGLTDEEKVMYKLEHG
jgi:hypothetical protein